MWATLLAAAALPLAAAFPSFSEWAATHGKTYATVEELALRRSIYAANAAKYEAFNAEGGHTYTLGVNAFSDLTAEEFTARYTRSYKPSRKAHRQQRGDGDGGAKTHAGGGASGRVQALPGSVDWVAAGAVTPVQDQGNCGAAFIWSDVEAVEGINFITTGKLVPLSEQELITCLDFGQACQTGLPGDDWPFILQYGLSSDAAWNGNCNNPPKTVTVTGFPTVTPNSDAALMTALVQQPVVVSVEADQEIFQGYTGGTITGACGTALDHFLLAVGYGTDAQGNDYYKLKNSWGTSWGEAGYVYLGRGPSYNGGQGECGVLMDAYYPTM